MTKCFEKYFCVLTACFFLGALASDEIQNIHKRSFHTDWYGVESRETNQEGYIQHNTVGYWDGLKPMRKTKGTVWVKGPGNFTSDHIRYAEKVFKSRAHKKILLEANKRNADIKKLYYWHPAKLISEFKVCFDDYVCTFKVTWDKKWTAKFTKELNTNPSLSRHPLKDFSYSTFNWHTNQVSFNHTFFGPGERGMWFKNLTWNTRICGNQLETLSYECMPDMIKPVKIHGKTEFGDGLIGFTSRSIPISIG